MVSLDMKFFFRLSFFFSKSFIKKHYKFLYLIGKPLLQKKKLSDIFIDPVLIGDCLIKKK